MIDKKLIKKLLKEKKADDKKKSKKLKLHKKLVKKKCKEFKVMLKVLGKERISFKYKGKQLNDAPIYRYYTNYSDNSREYLDGRLDAALKELYKEFKEKTGIDPNPPKEVKNICECGAELRGKYCHVCGKSIEDDGIYTNDLVKIIDGGRYFGKIDNEYVLIDNGTVVNTTHNIPYGTPVFMGPNGLTIKNEENSDIDTIPTDYVNCINCIYHNESGICDEFIYDRCRDYSLFKSKKTSIKDCFNCYNNTRDNNVCNYCKKTKHKSCWKPYNESLIKHKNCLNCSNCVLHNGYNSCKFKKECEKYSLWSFE